VALLDPYSEGAIVVDIFTLMLNTEAYAQPTAAVRLEKKEKQDWSQSSLSHSIGVMFVQNMSLIIRGMKLIWESVLME